MPTHLPGAFEGVPTFFRACCHDVKSRRVDAGYDHPGRELARHLETLFPYGLLPDEWAERLGRLALLARERDDEAVLSWFVEHYPRCMALVPRRRRKQFLAGVYEMLGRRSAFPEISGPCDPCPDLPEWGEGPI